MQSNGVLGPIGRLAVVIAALAVPASQAPAGNFTAVEVRLGGELKKTWNYQELLALPRTPFTTPRGKPKPAVRLATVLERSGVSKGTKVTVWSERNERSVELTWAETKDPKQNVMLAMPRDRFAILIAAEGRFQPREGWLKRVARIEVSP